MEKFSKKTLLNYVNGSGIYGAPSANQTVKFQYTTSLTTAATNDTAGALTFACDANGNAAIFAQGTLVSSKIQNIAAAAATGNKHGGKTVTISYVRMDEGHKGEIGTSTFDVIDEAALEAYFTGSKTITLDSSTKLYEVKLKENGGLAVDANDGIYAVLDNIFAVDGTTIGFKSDNKTIESLVKIAYIDGQAQGQTGNDRIALTDKDGVELTHVDVQDIIGGGIVDSTSYDPVTNTLTITWVGGTTTTIDLTKIFDISDWAVKTGSTDYLTLDISTAGGNAEIGVTDKVKTGISLAESAIQEVEKTTGVEDYVSLTVAHKTNDASTVQISIDGTALNTKITELDGSVGDISTRLHDYSVAADASIDRLDSSVTALEVAVAAMDADISTAVALNAANGIYVRGTLTEENGVVSAIDASALIADTSITRYNKAQSINPAWELNSDGLLNGDAATKLKNYIDDVAAQIKDEAGAVDTSLSDADTPNFISIHEEQEDGEITVFTINSSYGAYDYTAATHTFGTATNGLAKVADTQTFVQTVVESLDASVADKDSKEFVEIKIEETDGRLSSADVAVTYGAFTVTPGNVTASTQGVADASAVAAAVNGALVWTVLS